MIVQCLVERLGLTAQLRPALEQAQDILPWDERLVRLHLLCFRLAQVFLAAL